MTIDEAIELMKNEKACILKAGTCDRDCAKCEILRKTEDKEGKQEAYEASKD